MQFSLYLLLGILFFCNGCSFYMPQPCCPPPRSDRYPNTFSYSCTTSTVAPVVPTACETLTLAQLIDIGLQNSPSTRASWYVAKQAATDVGTARGAYLPSLDLSVQWLEQQLPSGGISLDEAFVFRQSIEQMLFSTNYLIFDFGGRNGALLSTMAALSSLCWSYNWEVQTVMAHVIQSYYNYIYLRALVAADEAAVADNWTTVEATQARKIAGAAAVSDELQARTVWLQSIIVLEQDRGNLNVAMATLVQALGLPPDTPICVCNLPDTIPTAEVCEDMAKLLQIAKERRTDLNARRADILQRRFQIQIAHSALLPNLNTQIQAGVESINGSRFLETYTAQVNFNVPLFHSFADINALRKAQAALMEAQAILDREELAVFLQTLTDYFQLIANQQILQFSDTYITVATENQEVAYANYRAGRTSIIDLMIANNSLNVARKQLITAKANFLTSIANLAYDTGNITVAELYGLKPEDSICEK